MSELLRNQGEINPPREVPPNVSNVLGDKALNGEGASLEQPFGYDLMRETKIEEFPDAPIATLTTLTFLVAGSTGDDRDDNF